MPEFDYMSALSVDGQIRSSAQGKVLGSFAVMPAASALSENAIVLYTGTTGTYVSGQFYMCVNTGSGYEWQPVTISGTEEDTYTVDRALVTNSLGQVTASGITATELGYLSGATSPLQAQINGKVTAVSGMGLSQNSYTTGEKNKLAGIAAGAQVNVIEAVQRNGSAVPVSGKTVNISVPVALSELTNDKGFIDSTVENLANFYTKTEVNSLVSTIPKFAVQVVSSLPASGQSATTIYLTPNSGSSGNVYDEYLWVNNAWEKIGSTQVSFTLDQDGNSIVINGTTLKDASSTSAGLMSITSYNDLQTAKSNISSLQSSYSTLNGTVSTLGTTVSELGSRLTTAESTLSTTVSRVSTCEDNIITGGTLSISGSGMDSLQITLALNNGVNIVSNTVYPNIILGYSIDESVSDPDDRVTYIADNAGWTPMSMSNGVLDAGSWATEYAGRALLNSIKPVVRHSDGTYEDLSKRNPSILASGGNPNFTTLGNDFLVYFANTFQWLSITKSGDIVTVKYATEQVDDTYHNYAFLDNDGQAKEGFSIGAVFAQSSGSNLYSSPESSIPEEISFTNAIAYAENRGATADIVTWDMKNYITGLFPLLFKTTNGQAHMWGNNDGRFDGIKSQNTVLTFTNDYGMNGTTANQTSRMAFLWIHDFWGSYVWWVGGAKTNSSTHLMVQHGARSSTDESDFEDTGLGDSLNGRITKMHASDTGVGFFPQENDGHSDTPKYYSDSCIEFPSRFPFVGGGYNYITGMPGPFFVCFDDLASVTYAVRLAFKEGENKA